MIIELIFIIGIIIGILAIIGLIVQALWNWIMPYLFGLPMISFWMAWGILLLIGFFLGWVKFK